MCAACSGALDPVVQGPGASVRHARVLAGSEPARGAAAGRHADTAAGERAHNSVCPGAPRCVIGRRIGSSAAPPSPAHSPLPAPLPHTHSARRWRGGAGPRARAPRSLSTTRCPRVSSCSASPSWSRTCWRIPCWRPAYGYVRAWALACVALLGWALAVLVFLLSDASIACCLAILAAARRL